MPQIKRFIVSFRTVNREIYQLNTFFRYFVHGDVFGFDVFVWTIRSMSQVRLR